MTGERVMRSWYSSWRGVHGVAHVPDDRGEKVSCPRRSWLTTAERERGAVAHCLQSSASARGTSFRCAREHLLHCELPVVGGHHRRASAAATLRRPLHLLGGCSPTDRNVRVNGYPRQPSRGSRSSLVTDCRSVPSPHVGMHGSGEPAAHELVLEQGLATLEHAPFA